MPEPTQVPQRRPLERVVIVGGGTAGWMAAAYLNRYLTRLKAKVVLVESPTLGTIGVGEATIPTLVHFIRLMNLDENEFMRRCAATYKLAIRFDDWYRPDTTYWHPFGISGAAWMGSICSISGSSGGSTPARRSPTRIIRFRCSSPAPKRRRGPSTARRRSRTGRLRLPSRRLGVRRVSQGHRHLRGGAAPVRRRAGCRPRRPWRHCEPRYRRRPRPRRRPVHRCDRLPRPADRAGARGSLDRLVAVHAVRPGGGAAAAALRQLSALYAVHRARRPDGAGRFR